MTVLWRSRAGAGVNQRSSVSGKMKFGVWGGVDWRPKNSKSIRMWEHESTTYAVPVQLMKDTLKILLLHPVCKNKQSFPRLMWREWERDDNAKEERSGETTSRFLSPWDFDGEPWEREHLEWLWDNWRGEGGWRTIVNGFGTIGLERRSWGQLEGGQVWKHCSLKSCWRSLGTRALQLFHSKCALFSESSSLILSATCSSVQCSQV